MPVLVNRLMILAALYAVLLVLQFVGLVPDLTPEAGLKLTDSGFSLGDTPSFAVWRLLQGRTLPNSLVEISINERVDKVVRTNSFGRFQTPLLIPVFADSIWARTLGKDLDVQVLDVYWDDPGTFSPILDIALVNEDDEWVWIAGRATPRSIVELSSVEGQYKVNLPSNSEGVFEVILPLEVELDGELVARVFGEQGELESPPVKIERFESEIFPLARTVQAHFSPEEQSIQIQVVLPESHPYYIGLHFGFISPGRFVQMTVGELYAENLLDITHTMGTESGLGKVDIRGIWRRRISTFQLQRSGNYGISNFPLMTTQDKVEVVVDDVSLEKEPSPRPDNRAENSLVWSGPIAPGKFTSIEVDFLTPTISQPVPDRKTQMQSEYLARFESEEAPEFVSQTWRALVLLIPFVGLVWIARRNGIFSLEHWKPLLALAVILTVWRSWNYFYFLVITGPSTWLQRLVTPIRFGLDLVGSEAEAELLANAGYNAFWIIFVAFVALVGFYMPIAKRWSGSLPAYRPNSVPMRHKIMRVFRYVYLGVISLLFITFFVVLRTDKLRVFEFVNIAMETVRGDANTFDAWEQMFQWEYNLNQWLSGRISIDDHEKFDFFMAILRSDIGWSFITLLWIALLLFAFGWRAGLFGIGLSLIGARAMIGSPMLLDSIWNLEGLQVLANNLDLIRRFAPWWGIVILTGGSAYFLVVQLLRLLTPPREENDPDWPHRRLAILLIVVAIGILHWSQFVLLFLGGSLVLLAVSWLTINGLRNFEPIKDWMNRFAPWRTPIRLGVLGVIMLLAWPRPGAGEEVIFRDMFDLFAQLDGIFVYIVAVGIALALYGHSKNKGPNQLEIDSTLLPLAVFLFAAYLINSYTRWLFIPVAFVVALLFADYWLFRPESEFQQLLLALDKAIANRRKLLKDVLDVGVAKSRLEAVSKGMTKKLESGDITPKDHQKKLDDFKKHYKEELELERIDSNYLSRDIIFASGEPGVWENTVLVLKYGAVLALLPIVISLYQYLPVSEVAFPYPLIDLITFIIPVTASWMLYAFFFGYFYVHIRGNSGLTKGLMMFAGLVVPFTVYRLLTTQSLTDMQPFIIWGTQVFIFCTLLGLLAIDYRLIRENGYGIKNLLAIHNLPFLSVYASSVIAAVVPTLVALTSDRVVDVFKFFLETVLPQVPVIGP